MPAGPAPGLSAETGRTLLWVCASLAVGLSEHCSV